MHESEKWKVKVKSLNRVWLLASPWTAAYQAPPSMGFSRQEYWSAVPLPSLFLSLLTPKQQEGTSLVVQWLRITSSIPGWGTKIAHGAPTCPIPQQRLTLCNNSCVWLFATPWTVVYQAPPSVGFPGKSTRVGCHFLLQEIFPTQALNPGLLHCRQTLYHLSHQGSL